MAAPNSTVKSLNKYTPIPVGFSVNLLVPKNPVINIFRS